MKLFEAAWILPRPGLPRACGGLLVDDGRVLAVRSGAAAVRRMERESGAQVIDLGEGLLTPGLINAHVHLDLTALAGRLPAGGDFLSWVGGLLRERAGVDVKTARRGVRKGLEQLAAAGCTALGDIDSQGNALEPLVRSPLRVTSYREALDIGDPTRRAELLRRLDSDPAPVGLTRGVSPHAPYSVSPELFEELGRRQRVAPGPITIHWSESKEEVRWLRDGQGPMARWFDRSPRRSGLDLIEGAGLLTSRTSLVHGNHPGRGEALRIARAGATLVHCPGSHRYFGREPFPLEHYRKRGVRLALGTDSAASNEALDMRREMALLRSSHPGLDPLEVFEMATLGGARALNRGRDLGRLARGTLADFCLFEMRAQEASEILEELTAGEPPLAGLWVTGKRLAKREGR